MLTRKLFAHIALILMVAGCSRSYEVPRSAWSTIRSGKDVYVRTHGGSAYELESFLFKDSTLVAIRGSQVAPIQAQLGSRVEIPLDSIAVVRARNADQDRTVALVASIAVVAGAILIADQAGDDRPRTTPNRSTGSSQGSCPYVYSFDGSEYVLDSETYAGAMARGLERTDVDNLEFIRPVDGSYRLTLANELDETEYTDELALLVADHPAGTRVFPDASGATRLVSSGVTPISVNEFAEPDSLPTHAGWEVEFVRPLDADSAALVVTARNSPALSFVASHLLSLMGPNVYTWYATVNDDSTSRVGMQRWLAEETFLHVSVLRAGVWVRIAALPNVGPAISKTQVVPFDFGDFSGDTVRVRLETFPQLWTLDSIELAPDFGPVAVRKAELVKARTERGRDVSRLISARDGSYHVALSGSRVDLEFRAPPDAGDARTVLVSTTGHYYIAADDSDASHLHEAFRIFADDEYARQYFQRAWKETKAETRPDGPR
jgi:hypothetical protein